MHFGIELVFDLRDFCALAVELEYRIVASKRLGSLLKGFSHLITELEIGSGRKNLCFKVDSGLRLSWKRKDKLEDMCCGTGNAKQRG